MNKSAEELVGILNHLPVAKWGIGDIAGVHPLAQHYPRAISLLWAYAPLFDDYSESAFHNLLVQKRLEFDDSINELSTFLKAQGINFLVIPHAEQDLETLNGLFSHKLAANRAGLGWIGKNSLLITEEFGPRIRLMTILVDMDLPCGQPVHESRCNGCCICVDACPYGYIRGVEWYPGIDRNLLFDPFRCSAKREEFVKSIGRKHSCGLCLLSCPQGK